MSKTKCVPLSLTVTGALAVALATTGAAEAVTSDAESGARKASARRRAAVEEGRSEGIGWLRYDAGLGERLRAI